MTRRASYSGITEHRHCPQKWYYDRMLRLERVADDAVPLQMGSWWHALRAMDSISRGKAAGTLQAFPDEVEASGVRMPTDPNRAGRDLAGTVLDESLRYWNSLEEDQRDAWITTVGEPLPVRLVTMDALWRDTHQKAIANEEPLAVEMWWERPLPTLPDGTDPDTILLGYIDEVYRDKERNIVVVRDHKAAKSLGMRSALDDMMDSQLQLYAWGAGPTIESWGHGSVRAVGYDRIRYPKPTTPRLTKSGTLSKSVTQFDLVTYLAWIEEGQPYEGLAKDGSGAGVYRAEQAVLDHLSSQQWRDTWAHRTLAPVNRNLVKAHLRAAVDSSLDIGRTVARAEREGEAQRNLTSGCKWCEFATLCRAQMIGGPRGEYPLIDHGLRTKPQREGAKG